MISDCPSEYLMLCPALQRQISLFDCNYNHAPGQGLHQLIRSMMGSPPSKSDSYTTPHHHEISGDHGSRKELLYSIDLKIDTNHQTLNFIITQYRQHTPVFLGIPGFLGTENLLRTEEMINSPMNYIEGTNAVLFIQTYTL